MLKKIVNKIFKKYPKMSFKETLDLTGLPCVTFWQGDKKLNFLLDSGSSDSIIDINILDDVEHQKIENRNFALTGLDGIKRTPKMCIISLSYKDKDYESRFLMTDMSPIFNEIKKDCGANLHGIIGADFMNKYRYILDFNELVAYSKK